MKKIILVSDGKEVAYGDTIAMELNHEGVSIKATVTVNKDTLENLLNAGIIKVVEDEPIKDELYYFNKLCSRFDWKPAKAASILDSFYALNPSIVFSMLLKEIAIDFDRKYKGHISESKEIWSVNSLNGEVFMANKNSIKNYRNFAAFRSKEEAEKACTILQVLLADMFEHTLDNE